MSQRSDGGRPVSFPTIFSHPKTHGDKRRRLGSEVNSRRQSIWVLFHSASFVFRESEARVADSSSPTSDRGSGRVMVVRKPTGALSMAYCFPALVSCGNSDRTLRTVLSVPFNVVRTRETFCRPPAPLPKRFVFLIGRDGHLAETYSFATGRKTDDVTPPSLPTNASGRRSRQTIDDQRLERCGHGQYKCQRGKILWSF